MSKKQKHSGIIAKAMLPNRERDILLDILGEISNSLKKIGEELSNIQKVIEQVRSKYSNK